MKFTYLILVFFLLISCKSTLHHASEAFELDIEKIRQLSASSDENKIAREVVQYKNSSLCLLTYENDGIERGIEIWSLKLNKRVYHIKLDNPNHSIDDAVPVDEGQLIQVSYNNTNIPSGGTTKYLFDLDKMVYYEKYFNTKAWEEISTSWYTDYNSYDNLINKEAFNKIKIKLAK